MVGIRDRLRALEAVRIRRLRVRAEARRADHQYRVGALAHGYFPGTRRRQLRDAALRLLLLHHPRHVRQQLPRVVDDAVLDRVLDAADPLGLARLARSGARAPVP